MTDTAKATKKSDIDPNFQDQVNQRKQDAAQEGEKRRRSQQVQVMMPKLGDWVGDLFDWDGVSKAFNRDQANDDFVKATSDARNPGVTGDLVATTLQVDYLSVMERAFRARHTMSFPRAIAQQSARKEAHGEDRGAFSQSALEFVRGVLKQSSS